MKRLTILAALFILAGCGSSSSTPNGATERTTTSTTAATTTTTATPVGPVGDVVVKRCAPDAANGTTAIDLAVTNHGTEAANYVITLEVRHRDEVAGTVGHNVNDVGPGETVDEHTSSSATGDGLRCVVTKVSRFPA